MTITETEPAEPLVAPLLRSLLPRIARFALDLGALTPDPIASELGRPNPALIAGINECARLLRPASVWSPTDHEAMREAFGELLQTVADLTDLEVDWEGYLDRHGLPRTTAVYDVTRGELLADRDHWVARLEAMSR